MRRATAGISRIRDTVHISIHALHEESDFVDAHAGDGLLISIHALHEESDQHDDHLVPIQNHFNPRSP